MALKITTSNHTYEVDTLSYGGRKVIGVMFNGNEERVYEIIGGLDTDKYIEKVDGEGYLIIKNAKGDIIFDGHSRTSRLVDILDDELKPGMKLIGMLLTTEGSPETKEKVNLLVTSRVQQVE